MDEKIKKLLRSALNECGIAADDIHIEHPDIFSHGDYSTNTAMRYAPQAKTSPKELAEKITRYIERNLPNEVEKVAVAGPGFINFYLSKEFFAKSLEDISNQNEKFGENKLLENKKVIIEYTDPNPFKEFHIGHLMSNAIGESLSRIVEYSHAEVKRANYQGDVGLHVAKAIWGKMQKPDASWGEAYAYGAQSYEDHKKEINEINKKIYEGSDSEINALYEKGKKASLADFEKIYKRLGTKFNFYFFESESGPIGLEIIKKHTNVFEKSDGAIIFHGEKFDKTLHTRVFVTKEGLPTYEAKELGLAKIKYDEYPHDVSIVITGNEVNDYFRVVYKAMEQVFPELAEKTKHVPHGMLRLTTGKMSSRTGDVISAESLLNDVKNRVLEKMKDTDLSEKEKIADQIAVGAVKYSILKQATGNDIIFDFEKSLSFEGDSGPYLQYTYARARSVMEKAKEAGIKASIKNPLPAITETEKFLYQFPEVVARSLNEHEPHYIATYLTRLASAFNNFYAKERIVDGGELAPYRLAIVEAVSIVLKNGLWLLGIEAPERI
ncbi:MAG: arginine--tRNA ligase [bacterium]|nr:arginine--tRNA ligase [bacterium]